MRGADAPARARPRLALVHYTAPPVTGGVEAVMAAQARRLRKVGYDVRVVAGRGDADVVPEMDSRHPEIEAMTARLKAGTATGAEFERLQQRIGRQLSALLSDRDLVIVHNVLTMPFNLPLTAALLDLGLPLLAWTHDLAWTNRRYADFRRPSWPYRLLGQSYRQVTHVVISNARRQELARAFKLPLGNVAVVPNGIDPVEFAGLSARARRLLQRADAIAADPLVLIPQRVAPHKRLELALQAVALLAGRFPAMRVLVTGPVDPHDASSLAYGESLLRQRAELGLDGIVHFLFEKAGKGGIHPVGSDDMAQFYRLSDVVLIPSGSEGFGLPLLEAALALVPVVCSDIRSFREVGGHGTRRFRARASPQEIAAVLERALAERPVRHRRALLRRYAWSEVLAQTEMVIADAIETDPCLDAPQCGKGA